MKRFSRFFPKNNTHAMTTTEPLSFLESTFRSIYPQDFEFRQRAEERLNQLTMPHWALGDLMDLPLIWPDDAVDAAAGGPEKWW